MDKLNSEIYDFASDAINLISCSFDSDKSFSIDEPFDWKGFISFCQKHRILNLVYYGIKSNNINISENIKKLFEENMLHSMMKCAQRDVEIELLSEQFENNKIRHMILKGFVIKNIYPEPYLRSMSDIDILVGDDIDKASDVLLQNGFELKSKEFLHYTFIKENSFAIELHKSLVDESLEKYYKYFKSGFVKAKVSDGFNYKYEFSKEDFYIFMVAHMAKHYSICGTGIRSVCDIYLYNKKFTDIDKDYINKELNKIGLSDFEKKIKNLAIEWFGGYFEGKFDSVGEYIILGGVYGNLDNHELNKFILNDKRTKKQYILRTIFPDKNYMFARYSFLKKAPVFIPLFWIVRIISTFFKSKGSIRYRLKGVSSYSSKDDNHFSDVGLK